MRYTGSIQSHGACANRVARALIAGIEEGESDISGDGEAVIRAGNRCLVVYSCTECYRGHHTVSGILMDLSGGARTGSVDGQGFAGAGGGIVIAIAAVAGLEGVGTRCQRSLD